MLVTYEITCQKGLSSTDLDLTKSFLTYIASADGQAKLDAVLGYAPLPADLLTKVQASVAAISLTATVLNSRTNTARCGPVVPVGCDGARVVQGSRAGGPR